LSPAPANPLPPDAPLRSGVVAYLRERLGLDSVEALAEKKHVPVHRETIFYYLGGMRLFLFENQLAQRILLSLYYKPSPDQAFESVRAIMTEIDFGWLMRSIHSWSANLIIGVLFLHLLTTYMMRAYRGPREFTWITGCILLGIFMAFGFSGYLLPWNELAFSATRVGTEIVGVVPWIGDELLLLARGGENVTGDTLARFYALHVVILPIVTFGLLGIHLFLVQKHGMSVPDRVVRRQGSFEAVPNMRFIPDFLLRDMVGWFVALGFLAVLGALFPWELGEKANPFGSTPEGIKPEWYFLFMFQLLKLIPGHVLGLEGKMLGVLACGAAGLVVLLVPFLDRGETPGRARMVFNLLAAAAVTFFIAMTAWGFFDKLQFQLALGGLLFAGVLALSVAALERGAPLRRLVILLSVLSSLVCVGMLAWGLRG